MAQSGIRPVGPVYDEAEAQRLARNRRWTVAREEKGWRRVVASPAPLDILEARVIELLVRQGVTICAGGGGIPVVQRDDGSLVGIEAVIDKDHASALLARKLGAQHLLLLTDVDTAYLGWNTDDKRAIAAAHPSARDPAQFSEGSMRPKIEAAIGFVNETGHVASIGRLEDVAAILDGQAGTAIRLDAPRTAQLR